MGANKVIILGRVGQDPNTRSVGDKQVSSFSVAVGDPYSGKDEQGNFKHTEWFNLVCWGKHAEIASKYVKKGQELYAEGKLKTEKWEKDGVPHSKVTVVVSEMSFVGDRKNSDSAESTSAPSAPAKTTPAKAPAKTQQAAKTPAPAPAAPVTADVDTESGDDLPF